MSSYFVACCHPEGEADNYDGLFYRDNEFEGLTKQLVGKPLLFNHEESMPLGKVVSAWADKPNDDANAKRQVFALCEIDDGSLNGKLTKRGIDKQVLQDVSIGHTCTINQSNGVQQVSSKTASELSVCERGAREHTHIYAVSWQPTPTVQATAPATYIKVTASADTENNNKKIDSTKPKMTSTTPLTTSPEAQAQEVSTPVSAVETAPAPPAPNAVQAGEAPAATEAQAPKVQLTHSVLAQLKKLQAENSRLAADLSSYQESSRKVREAEMNGGVRAYIEKLISENPELGNHKAELEALMTKMVDSETAGPLVKLLRCAASKSTNSITELEKQYQMQKSKDKRIAELTAELETLKSDAFALTEERVGTVQVGASAGLAGNKRARTTEREKPKSIFDEIGDALRSSAGTSVPTLRAEEFHMKRSSPREEFL